MIILTVVLLAACTTKYNYTDTGISIGYYDGSVYDYLKSDRGNWDSIAKVIDKCSPELIELLKTEEVTFLGPKNIAFDKYFFWGKPENASTAVTNYNHEGYAAIDNLPRHLCDSLVKSHLVRGIIMRDDIARGVKDEEGKYIGGGKLVTTLQGNKIWLWTLRNAFAGVPETADVEVQLASVKADGLTIINNLGTVATTNLEAQNGVVHALGDHYFLGQLFEYKP